MNNIIISDTMKCFQEIQPQHHPNPQMSAIPPTDAYYNCMEHIGRDMTLKLNIILQWLNHLEQHNQVHHVHYVRNSTPDLICPNLCSYNTILTGGVDLLRTTNTTLPVVIDSGESKAISGFKE